MSWLSFFGLSTRAQVGSRMVSQRRYASSRHWSIHSGSFFLAEMKRTVSSERPFSAFSDSMLVSNPYLYWSTSIRRTCSTVSCTAGSFPSAHGGKDRGLDLSVMVGSLLRFAIVLVRPPSGGNIPVRLALK